MSMMIMGCGSLSRQPAQRTSSKGNAYTTAAIRTSDGDDALFINVTAFGELAGTLAGMEKGSPITVVGNGKVSTYEAKDSATKAGLSITASRIVALIDQQAAPRPKTERREDR